jgi:hypothetical protein
MCSVENACSDANCTKVWQTPWSRVLPEKLKCPELLKKFPAFYETRRFITVYISARHLSLAWARSIHSTPPHPTSRRSILILSSHLRLGLPSGLLPSGFPTKVLYAPLFSPIRATCPAHLSLLDVSTWMISGEEYTYKMERKPSWEANILFFYNLLYKMQQDFMSVANYNFEGERLSHTKHSAPIGSVSDLHSLPFCSSIIHNLCNFLTKWTYFPTQLLHHTREHNLVTPKMT